MGARFLPALLTAAVLLPAAGGVGAGGVGRSITLRADKREIVISSGLRGGLLRVNGQAPEDADIVIRMCSETAGETLGLKRKRGVLWLSAGEVRFEKAPRVYLIRSSRPLEEILSPSQQARLDLGLHGLRSSVRVQRGADADLFVSEFLRLKRDKGLYDWTGGGVRREGGGGYGTEFPWPSQAPPGTYRVEAFALSRGSLLSSSAVTVVVKKAGAEEWVSRMAAEHGMVYGLLSAALAVATGLVTNAFFVALGRRRRREPSAPPS